MYNLKMDINTIWTSLIFMVIGYFIGSFSWSIFLSKIIKKGDIRNEGSGNAGATNSLRKYGMKFGAIVFVLDISKSVISIFIAFAFANYVGGIWSTTIVQLAGLGAIIGHIWPVYYKFKGGKGSATLLGLLITMNWVACLIGAVLYIMIIWRTKYVSLASLLIPIQVLITAAIFIYAIPHMGDTWTNPMTRGPELWMTIVVSIVGLSLTWYTHRGNIKRLLTGTERKFGESK